MRSLPDFVIDKFRLNMRKHAPTRKNHLRMGKTLSIVVIFILKPRAICRAGNCAYSGKIKIVKNRYVRPPSWHNRLRRSPCAVTERHAEFQIKSSCWSTTTLGLWHSLSEQIVEMAEAERSYTASPEMASRTLYGIDERHRFTVAK